MLVDSWGIHLFALSYQEVPLESWLFPSVRL
jgi:hypothetical protein